MNEMYTFEMEGTIIGADVWQEADDAKRAVVTINGEMAVSVDWFPAMPDYLHCSVYQEGSDRPVFTAPYSFGDYPIENAFGDLLMETEAGVVTVVFYNTGDGFALRVNGKRMASLWADVSGDVNIEIDNANSDDSHRITTVLDFKTKWEV